MVRILLVQPPIYDFNAFDLWVRPLGWLNLAALLEAAGAEVVLADALDRYQPDAQGLPLRSHRMGRFGCGHYYSEDEEKPACLRFVPRTYKRFGLPRERFRNLLASLPRPDLVLTGCAMTYWYPGVQETIALVRSLWPGTPIGVAGIYAILCFEHAQSVLGADFVYGGHDLLTLAGMVDERTGGRLRLNDIDPDRYREPACHLMSQRWSLPLQTSSGCVFRCSYCASHRLQPRFRQFPVADLVGMLNNGAREFGTTDWAFYDDALLVNAREHFMPLMRAAIDSGLAFRFHVPNALHCRSIDRETADLMKEAGFETIRLGLEFTQEHRQKGSGAKVRWKEYVEAVETLFASGFQPGQLGTYVMIGYPGQSVEEMRESCLRVHEQGSPIRLTMFSPIPGTRDFESDFSSWRFDPRSDPLLQNCSLTPFRSRDLTLEVYEELKEQVNAWNREVTGERI